MVNKLILIRGWPGSGKTTLGKKLAEKGDIVHCETDQFFVVEGEYRFDKSMLSIAHSWCLASTRCYLRMNTSVVVSNTFTRKWEISPYEALAEHEKIPIVYIRCIGAYKSEHDVPSSTILRMKNEYEPIASEIIYKDNIDIIRKMVRE